MPNNILITPGSASIQFSGSAANTIRLQVESSGSIAFYGNSGSLFGITDSLSGSLMSVNDISGLPILEVFSDDRIVMGTFNKNTLVVTGSRVGIDKAIPTADLDISGSVFITGSLRISSGGITGSLFGTSSVATTASFATSASAADSITFIPPTASFATSASFALSASYAPSAPGGGITSLTAGDGLTGGTITSTGTITLDTGSAHFLDGVKKELNTEGVISSSIQINTGSFSGSFTGELIGTSSYAMSASYVLTAVSSSFATSASAADSITFIPPTASFATSASFAPPTFPFTGSAIVSGSIRVTGSLNISGSLIATAPPSQWNALFYEAGITPDNSEVLSAGTNKGISVQGSDAAYYMGRATGPNIEYIMGISTSQYAFAGAITAHDFALRTNNADRVTIKATTGNVGIGVTAPVNTLQVQGNVSASSYTSSISNGVGFVGTASYALSASYAPSAPGGGITSLVAGDGLTGGTITSTGTITLNTGSVHFLDGVKKELNTEGVISSSVQINTGSFTGSFTGALTHFNPSTLKLTVGTTAPASPSVNDLWVDTN